MNLKHKGFQHFAPKNFFEFVHILGNVFRPVMWLPNEINKKAIPDAEISDYRYGTQLGYGQALYPRLHDIFDFLCF